MKNIFFILFFILFLIACEKDDTVKNNTPTADFPLGTTWTGVLTAYNNARPDVVSLEIKEDKKVMMYGALGYLDANNNVKLLDSVAGSLTDLREENGIPHFTLEFPELSTIHKVAIKGGKLLEDTEQPVAGKLDFIFQLKLFSLEQVTAIGDWYGPKIEKMPGDIDYYFPDVNGVIFKKNGVVSYIRGGVPVYTGVPQTGSYYEVTGAYEQTGARLYVHGLDESNLKFPLYFGVFTETGDTILLDTHDPDARLTSAFDTNEPYGPSGWAPQIYRRK